MDGEVRKFESGSDFCLTLKTSQNLYARGDNKYGQLGRGDFEPSEESQIVERLLEVQISDIFAGGSSCFAVVDKKQGHEVFVQELLKENQEEEMSSGEVKGMVTLNAADGQVNVHRAMVNALKLKVVSKTLTRSKLLFVVRLLYGELIGKDVR
jgi:alpha-tubulin suppressor-like RCC1 family protein